MRNLNVIVTLTLLSSLICVACNEESTSVSCEASGLQATVGTVANVSCDGPGSALVAVRGGKGPYLFSFFEDFRETQPSSELENLAAGNYTVYVRDQNFCETSDSFNVGVAEGAISFSLTQSSDAGCGGSEGVVKVDASGGSGEYTYRVNGETAQTENTLVGLAAGETEFEVMDTDGCQVSVNFRVNSGVSFGSTIDGQSESIQNIITENCAISGCHVAETALPDFTLFASIEANADEIKIRTQNRTMPQNSTLTQEQIDLIACWVDDGAILK